MSKKKRAFIPMVEVFSIRPTYSVSYLVRFDQLPPSRAHSDMPRIKRNEFLSNKAASRMKNAVSWMLLFSHKKTVYSKKENKRFSFVLNFITLTLSETQKHDDSYIVKHMLQPFLKWLGRNKAKLYVWRAESQRNGNLHFHITTNTFIHWKSIRRKWNQLQSKHGYMKKWTEGNMRNDPNSTDIHAVKNEKQTASYMAKYMTKAPIEKDCARYMSIDEKPIMPFILNELYEDKNGMQCKRRNISGRLWGCSETLSNLKIYLTPFDSEQFQESAEWLTGVSEEKKLDYSTLWMHKNLKYLQPKGTIRNELAKLYEERKEVISQQKFFTVESFY